jgi:hypothetical protein
MIKEEKIFLVPPRWSQEIVPDWKRCEMLEEKNGHVDAHMIMRELMVTWEKASRIVRRWESMKNAREVQKRLAGVNENA